MTPKSEVEVQLNKVTVFVLYPFTHFILGAKPMEPSDPSQQLQEGIQRIIRDLGAPIEEAKQTFIANGLFIGDDAVEINNALVEIEGIKATAVKMGESLCSKMATQDTLSSSEFVSEVLTEFEASFGKCKARFASLRDKMLTLVSAWIKTPSPK